MEKNMMHKINITEIPKSGKYDGYVWMSNATEPIVLRKEGLPCEFLGSNPFVVEALLYDGETNISYSVRQAGNETICVEADGQTAANDKNTISYLSSSNSLKGLRLRFCNIWEEREDEACLGMKRLTFIGRAFIGFDIDNKAKEDKA